MFPHITGAFNPDSPIAFILYGVILAFIVAMSLYYLLSSVKRAKKIGMEMGKIRKVITTSVTFSILPAIGIALGVVTLMGALGIAFPAIRLSVIGALHYETQMANGAAEAITGVSQGAMTELLRIGVTAKDFVTISTVMTVAIMAGPILVFFCYKRLQPKIGMLSGKTTSSANGKVNIGDLVFQVVFIGMILGYFAMTISEIAGAPSTVMSYYNFIAIVVAMICMYVFEVLVKKCNWKWLDSLSTPLAMIIAMVVVGVISYFAFKNGLVPEGFYDKL